MRQSSKTRRKQQWEKQGLPVGTPPPPQHRFHVNNVSWFCNFLFYTDTHPQICSSLLAMSRLLLFESFSGLWRISSRASYLVSPRRVWPARQESDPAWTSTPGCRKSDLICHCWKTGSEGGGKRVGRKILWITKHIKQNKRPNKPTYQYSMVTSVMVACPLLKSTCVQTEDSQAQMCFMDWSQTPSQTTTCRSSLTQFPNRSDCCWSDLL